MINSERIKKSLFLDIETATITESYLQLPPAVQLEWERKCRTKYKDDFNAGLTYDAIYHKIGALEIDFAKVICITLGVINKDNQAIVKSIYGDDEYEILCKFNDALIKMSRSSLTGFNIKGYDIPFLCRKFIKHKMQIPVSLTRIVTSKPWEAESFLFDLMTFWSFGEFGLRSTFGMMCDSLGVSTPKEIMSGDKVSDAYWRQELNDIVRYCEADVLAVIQCCQQLMNIY